MRLLITTLYLLLLSMFASDACSQTPDKDPIWQLRWQEEFNFNIDNTKPWDAPTGLTQKRYLNNRGWTFEACHMQIDGNVRQTTDGTNLRMTNAGTLGVLKITLDKLPSPMSVIYTQDCGGTPLSPAKVVDYNYTTGYMHMSQLISQNFDMDYGFYEMKFRIPPAIQNGQHRNRGIQTNWWMCCGSQNVKTSDPDYFTEYFELDFFEISGEENRVTHNYYNARVKDKQGLPGQSGHSAAANETNFKFVNTEYARTNWKYNSLENYAGFYKLDDLSVFKPGTETEGWHTVGVEVLPNTINWYYDGVFVQTMSNLWYSQTMRPTSSYQFLLNDNFPYIGWSEMEIVI